MLDRGVGYAALGRTIDERVAIRNVEISQIGETDLQPASRAIEGGADAPTWIFPAVKWRSLACAAGASAENQLRAKRSPASGLWTPSLRSHKWTRPAVVHCVSIRIFCQDFRDETAYI